MSKWLFAKLLPYASRRHERLVADRKRELFATLGAHDVVVELGAGTGPNFRYYPPTIQWIGIEPNGFLNPALTEASRGFNTRILELAAESIPLGDGIADAVVCTLVLCSVADPKLVLCEVLRVLKPGGRFYFIEHVGARRGSGLRLVQQIVQPIWKLCADGCRTCRDTALSLQNAGFEQLELQAFTLPLGIFSPHVAGVGIKRHA